ncbi:MAG: hypothetical protein OWP43_04560 [Sphaerochaetaceae bacterium]|nr:hypothetical protein [Sphaerochaetaceae bacterium]MDC7242951.1 hypothetical protein [Sphaerochaetaceae bacterium]
MTKENQLFSINRKYRSLLDGKIEVITFVMNSAFEEALDKINMEIYNYLYNKYFLFKKYLKSETILILNSSY